MSEHPLIRGLFDMLPPPDCFWSDEDRHEWIATARQIFRVLYTRPLPPDHPRYMAWWSGDRD